VVGERFGFVGVWRICAAAGRAGAGTAPRSTHARASSWPRRARHAEPSLADVEAVQSQHPVVVLGPRLEVSEIPLDARSVLGIRREHHALGDLRFTRSLREPVGWRYVNAPVHSLVESSSVIVRFFTRIKLEKAPDRRTPPADETEGALGTPNGVKKTTRRLCTFQFRRAPDGVVRASVLANGWP
jgi:hypothetical protein